MSDKLTFEAVYNLMKEFFFPEDKDMSTVPESDILKVDGIVQSFGFQKSAVEAHKAEVKKLLDELSQDFHVGGGGGMSVMNMVADKDGKQWGGQREAEALCVLAIACELGNWSLPRDLWHILPGGMPYFTVNA